MPKPDEPEFEVGRAMPDMVGIAHPCMIKIILILVEVTSRIRVSLGKPSRPEDRHNRLSLCVDWLPALFANTAEYPRLRACIRKDGRRLCRVREPVLIVSELSLRSHHDN